MKDLPDVGTVSAKMLSMGDFLKLGYLQEVNRQFFHPLGLTLEVRVGDEENFYGRVRDLREFPGGACFTKLGGSSDEASAAYIASQVRDRKAAREARLGSSIQPMEEPKSALPKVRSCSWCGQDREGCRDVGLTRQVCRDCDQGQQGEANVSRDEGDCRDCEGCIDCVAREYGVGDEPGDRG